MLHTHHQQVQHQDQTSNKYKSKFEADFAATLNKKKIVFTYETLEIDYEITKQKDIISMLLKAFNYYLLKIDHIDLKTTPLFYIKAR